MNGCAILARLSGFALVFGLWRSVTDEEDKRRFGYSRDHRPDCVQVVIAGCSLAAVRVIRYRNVDAVPPRPESSLTVVANSRSWLSTTFASS